ncbi:COX aromatic rich motif-containing protein [Roseibium sp. RKSG952]|uniref:COX aromatic rich motif-containing protein n=1 Tax=Roseibium sp. RKSG952 TaxID=2529384 RepID=UPI001FCB9F13|nr:COX aromatic rich motif-containing protein [Roseibium sp. RKSG952]
MFPSGPIGQAQRDLLFDAFWLMMIVAIPVYLLAIFFIWRYRRSHKGNATYKPHWEGNWQIETVVWTVPALIVIVIAYLQITGTQKLDPFRQIDPNLKSFQVQAVAQDWKWLFIYPELGVATVNELAFPADRPLTIDITSDTVMNSFMIPALGGQIYAMAGMRTELNLLANEPGTFTGRNTLYSGDGYSEQYFQAHAMTDADFSAWREKVAASANALDAQTYVDLQKPSVANPVTYYSSFEPNLFTIILRKYAPIVGPYESEAAELICRGSAA